MTQPDLGSPQQVAAEAAATDRRAAGLRPPSRLPRWVAPALWAVALAAAVGIGAGAELGFMTLATNALMYALLTQGWNVLSGYGGYMNFGMVVFFGLGAYGTAIPYDRLGWSPWLTLPLAGAVAALLALIIGVPSLRLRGPYFAILTLTISFLVQVWAFNSDLTRGAAGIYLESPGDSARAAEQIFYFAFLALVVASALAVWRMERSRFGYALRAIREDEDAAAVLGVRTVRVKLLAFLAGAFMAGVAGGLYAYRLAYIEPGGTFDLGISVNVVLMCVVGGLGAWQGPLIGAPLVIFLSEALRVGLARTELFGATVPPAFNRIVLGAILVGFALFAKEGIVGLLRRRKGRRLGV